MTEITIVSIVPPSVAVLALDNVNLCYAPEYGDLNYDCFVDMFDFSLFAEDWLCDCSDPANLPDPNDCAWSRDGFGNVTTNYAGDINNDNAVNDTDPSRKVKLH